jgi:hypothetical protein
MEFYILLILLPALPIDIALTVHYLRKNRKIMSVLATAFLYLIAALICIAIFSQDSRFQGQGIIGLMLFFAVGTSLALIRLLVGIVILLDRKLR